MRNGLYPKLAAQGMKQNRRFFLPYLLALAGSIAAFYVMCALCSDPGVLEMRGFAYVMVMMQIGMFVAGILSAILLLYINSFLMKQRKKELALYNILGMGKGNIALIQCWESLYTAIIGIGGGLLCGVALHKLATVALTSLLRFHIPFHSSVSLPAMMTTAVFFGGLLILALVLDLLACNMVLKPLIGRGRPFLLRPDLILLASPPGDASFPSGHTAAAFAVVFALKTAGSPLWLPALALAVVTAFSRLYLYVHWPTDVLGGVLLGAAVGWAGAKLAEALLKKDRKP